MTAQLESQTHRDHATNKHEANFNETLAQLQAEVERANQATIVAQEAASEEAATATAHAQQEIQHREIQIQAVREELEVRSQELSNLKATHQELESRSTVKSNDEAEVRQRTLELERQIADLNAETTTLRDQVKIARTSMSEAGLTLANGDVVLNVDDGKPADTAKDSALAGVKNLLRLVQCQRLDRKSIQVLRGYFLFLHVVIAYFTIWSGNTVAVAAESDGA